MFRGTYIKDVDRKVAYEWAKCFLVGAPFSRLRLSWKEEHCKILNRYSSSECPYPERDCALSFLQCVMTTLSEADAKHAVGYFRAVARRLALERLENKPLARERPGLTGTARSGPEAGPRVRSEVRSVPEIDPASSEALSDLHRSRARPLSIGEVLGTLNFGTREGQPQDGEKGKK
jgi:hypothetical protein